MKAYSRDETSESITRRKAEAWKSIRAEGEKSKFHHDQIYTTLTDVLFPEAAKVYREILRKSKRGVCFDILD